MLHKGLKWLLAAWLGVTAPAVADTQFGVYGLHSLTNHEDLPHPAGVGVFLQKDISRDLRLRVSASIGCDRENYIATVGRGWGLLAPGDTVRDLWRESTKMSAIEISLLGRPFESRVIYVFVGGGIGLTSFDWEIKGRDAGYKKSTDAGPRLAFSLVGDFEITHPRLNPLVAHFWVRERVTMAAMMVATDRPGLFLDKVTSAEIALAIALCL